MYYTLNPGNTDSGKTILYYSIKTRQVSQSQSILDPSRLVDWGGTETLESISYLGPIDTKVIDFLVFI